MFVNKLKRVLQIKLGRRDGRAFVVSEPSNKY